MPDPRYELTLSDGTVIEGRLDARGFERIVGVAVGVCKVVYPDLDAREWDETSIRSGRRDRDRGCGIVPRHVRKAWSASMSLQAAGARTGSREAGAVGRGDVVETHARPVGIAAVRDKIATLTESRQLVPSPGVDVVARAAADDRAARAELYRDHATGVARHLVALVGDLRVAEDLTQDVFVTAFDRLGTYDARVPVAVWLHGIAVNVARNHWRRTRRRGSLWQRFALRETIDERSPESIAEGRELADRLYLALGRLDPAAREAFVLRVIEQMPLEEAARVLGVSAKRVSHRAVAAQRRIRAWLEEGS